MLIVLICGSRDWIGLEEAELIKEELKLLPRDAIIVHGAAPGADSLAGFEADLMGFEVASIEANWEEHYLAAGPIRNRKMLDGLLKARAAGYKIRVIAFHHDPQLGKGTRDMINLAEFHDIPVKKIIRPSLLQHRAQ